MVWLHSVASLHDTHISEARRTGGTSIPQHPHYQTNRSRARLLFAQQKLLGLIDLRREVGGAAAIRMELLHQASVRRPDLLLTCVLFQSKNFIRLATSFRRRPPPPGSPLAAVATHRHGPGPDRRAAVLRTLHLPEYIQSAVPEVDRE